MTDPVRRNPLTRVLYGAYAWSLFLVVGCLGLLAVLPLPGVTRRRAVARACARFWLRIAGMPLTVDGLRHLPPGPCILVANHASYLDGVVMTAALPPRFGFVIKREMNGVPLAGLLLRRIGSEFVERFNRHRSAADARRVMRSATSGQSLVFFPEGTFSEEPGLLKFHTGAFVTAVRAGCPVVPAVIRGTRVGLPASSPWPEPTPIRVEIMEPIASSDLEPAHATTALRDEARRAILHRLGEPDLGARADGVALDPSAQQT